MPNHPATSPAPVLRDDALYLGDNGRCLCGAHSGSSARFTGRDISGQKVLRLTAATLRDCGHDPAAFRCEQPGCEVRL